MGELGNTGFGTIGTMIWILLLFVFTLLNKDKGETASFNRALLSATIIVGIYTVIIAFIKFIPEGFDKGVYEDIKRLIILISLLISWQQAKKYLKNPTKEFPEWRIRVWGWVSVILSISIVIAMYTQVEWIEIFVDVINDFWGIVATLYAAFAIFVLNKESKESNNSNGSIEPNEDVE